LFTRLSDPSKLLEYQRQRLATPSTDSSYVARPEYAIDDSDLIGIDEAGIRSINGARLAQILIETVPDLENFRITLRAIKEWAIGHGIYSNVLGFLGGVNCAIMVAWVCQRHPQEPIASLLKIFFETFVFWQWPTPVALTPLAQVAPPGGTLLSFSLLARYNEHRL
jgi:poly(A) polymerase